MCLVTDCFYATTDFYRLVGREWYSWKIQQNFAFYNSFLFNILAEYFMLHMLQAPKCQWPTWHLTTVLIGRFEVFLCHTHCGTSLQCNLVGIFRIGLFKSKFDSKSRWKFLLKSFGEFMNTEKASFVKCWCLGLQPHRSKFIPILVNNILWLSIHMIYNYLHVAFLYS